MSVGSHKHYFYSFSEAAMITKLDYFIKPDYKGRSSRLYPYSPDQGAYGANLRRDSKEQALYQPSHCFLSPLMQIAG